MFLLHNVGVANMILLAFLLLAIQPAVPHRTVEMTPVAAEGELTKELGRYGMTA